MSTSTVRRTRRVSTILAGVALAAAAFWLSVSTDSQVGAARLTAILAFFGVIITAAAADIVERRSSRRLHLEAAMRAGSLLRSSHHESVDPASAASGLLALTNLDHAELAVALLVDLWPDSERTHTTRVSKETAILVINAALQSGDSTPNAPLVAAELLCRHARDLDACQSLHWPASLDGRWLPKAGPKTKLLLIEALVDMSITTTPSPNALRSFAVRVYGIWRGDPDPDVRGCVAGLIKAIVPALESSPYKNFMQGSKNVTLGQLKHAATYEREKTDEFLAHVMSCRKRQLETWTSQCLGVEGTPEHMRPGALSHGWCDVAGRA